MTLTEMTPPSASRSCQVSPGPHHQVTWAEQPRASETAGSHPSSNSPMESMHAYRAPGGLGVTWLLQGKATAAQFFFPLCITHLECLRQ